MVKNSIVQAFPARETVKGRGKKALGLVAITEGPLLMARLKE